MDYLYLLSETYTNGYRVEILDIISLIAILCSILVIISKNPIVSVLFLIGLFLSIASYLILLGLNFIGLSYLLVYVGAVSILFLFILMLINVRISELLSNTSNSIPLAIFISISVSYPVYVILPNCIVVVQDYLLNIKSTISYAYHFVCYILKMSSTFGEIDNGKIYYVTSKL
jgi:NADH-ubiquinone oxidoreductase chain 6